MQRSSEENLASLARSYINAPMGLCYLDLNLRYVHINKWLAAINGFSPEDHIGKTIMQMLPEVAAGIEPIFRQVIETGQPILRKTIATPTPAEPNIIRHFIQNYYPDKNEDGLVVGVACSIEDITDLKWAEEGLLAAQESLERRVQQRTKELNQANEQLRSLLESTKAVPWVADARTWRFTYVGPKALELLGYPIEDWYDRDFWPKHIHPDDRQYALDYCLESSKSMEHYEFEYRMIASDGREVWLLDIVNVQLADGEPVTLRGFMFDITERKLIEHKLQASQREARRLARKLLTAQEVERKKIARELHDDLTQRLASLAVDASVVHGKLNGLSPPIDDAMTDLTVKIRKLSSDVNQLSRQLHPSILDDLGLSKAIESECDQFNKLTGMPVELDLQFNSVTISNEMALSAYRILQESLRTSVRHANAANIRVTLSADAKELALRVADTGVGFVPNDDHERRGLGLVSMRERVGLFNGTLIVDSKPGVGTSIEARFPLEKGPA